MSKFNKQIKAVRKLAVKFREMNPEHFDAVIAEIDATISENLLAVEAMENEYSNESLNDNDMMREIA